MHGLEKLKVLTYIYGSPQSITFKSKTALCIPDIDQYLIEAEWKLFRQVLFTKFKSSTAKEVIHALLSNSTFQSTFLQLVTVAMILVIVPVTTATVDRNFSNMRLVKTRSRNHLVDTSFDQAMRVSIEGPETLGNEN